MRNSRAFTLLEVLIALTLSSFIMLALTQAYRNASKFVEKSFEFMVDNRKTFLVFNQLEKDISVAFIPTIHKEIKPLKDKADPKSADPKPVENKPETPEEVKEKKKKELEKLKEFFLGTEGEGETYKFEDRRLKAFGRLTFITTNPLQVYGSDLVRFVRVAYELVKDKEKSTKEYLSYKLVRKESNDIEDVTMKVSQFDYAKVAQQVIREQTVIDDVKSMHVEYITFKEEKPEDKKDKDDQKRLADLYKTAGREGEEKKKEEIRLFAWGEKPETWGVVPQRIEITLVIWNRNFLGEHMFHMMVPLLTYPTEHSDDVKHALQQAQQAQQDQAAPGQQGQQGGKAQPGTPAVGATPQQPKKGP